MEELTTCTIDSEVLFYDDDLLKQDKYRLLEIAQQMQPLTSQVYKIKQKMEDDLRDLKIKVNDFIDFKLDTMKILSSLRKEIPIHEFLKESYTGCFFAMLYSEVIVETTKNLDEQKMVKELREQLKGVLLVIANALEKQGWSVPDSRLIRQHFQGLKQKLPSLCEEYVKKNPNHALLRTHKQLIINFQIIKEMKISIGRLRELVEEQRKKFNIDAVTGNTDDLLLTEAMDTSAVYEMFLDLKNN